MKPEIYKLAMEAKTHAEFIKYFEEGCSLCSLSEHNNRPVLCRGNHNAPILLIGEAPGANEDKLRKPFVGEAGKLLDRIMSAIGLDTNRDILLTNIAYCRPIAGENSYKQNYTPKREQTSICTKFTEKHIQILKPKIIIACGRTALCNLGRDQGMKIKDWEGKWTWYYSRRDTDRSLIPMFVMTHPAALIHLEAKAPKEDYLKTKLRVWEYIKYFRDTYKERL